MARYVAYQNLTTPDEVLDSMVAYIKSLGYTIVRDIAPDANIYDQSTIDGNIFVFKNKTNKYYIILRTANGTQIFGNNDYTVTVPITDDNYTGVGMTVAEGYDPSSGRWYDQYRAPKELNIRPSGAAGVDEIYGVFMPMKVGNGYSYTLYCNNVPNPTDTLVFTLEKENDTYHQVTHLVYADVNKYDTWEGGALFSGSSVKQLMGNDVRVYEHTKNSDQFILPILSSGSVTNTFLRVDIGEAPTVPRGVINWASSGTDNITGKRLSMPMRLNNSGGDNITSNQYGNGIIPHYFFLQSQGRLDWGRNINTLNCITMDMPIYVCVLTDPDEQGNYAPVGHISGAYFVSLLNMQTAGLYERNYPASNDLSFVAPLRGKRRGANGFDGISIQQRTIQP